MMRRSFGRVWLLGLATGLAFPGSSGCEESTKGTHEPEPLTAADTQSPAEQREARRALVTGLAPAPLRAGLPLLGAPGRDKDGYPTQFVDQALLRSLLFHGRYTELDAHFEHFQGAFEADPRHEYWPIDATDAFGSSEPELGRKLDAWLAASPESFGAHLARGSHRLSLAWAMRGGKWARETPEENFRAMAAALEGADRDFSRALELRPRLIAALRGLIQVLLHSAGSDARQAALIERATTLCPACFQVRVTALVALEPRWGGSHEAMGRLALAARAELNPRMRLLPGYIDADRASLLRGQKQLDQALAAIDRACALGEHWEFLVERGEILQRMERHPEALAALERAAQLRPGAVRVHFARAWALTGARRYEEAGLALLAGLRIDPTDNDGRRLYPSAVKNLIYEGWQHYRQGHEADAVRVFDLAIELDQGNRDANQRRTVILGGGRKPDLARVELMESRHRESPEDLFVLRQLDYALSFAKRDYQRIDALWTEYLARHPEEGRALVERGGTRHHLRRPAESKADFRRAGELGFSEGCALYLR